MKDKKVSFRAYGANGYDDPRLREGSGVRCSECKKPFSYWDDLQVNINDEKYLCADCKGIQIELITGPND